MAFLARRGLPEQLVLLILELTGPDFIGNVCATNSENRDFIAERMAPVFRGTWHNTVRVGTNVSLEGRPPTGARNVRLCLPADAEETEQQDGPWPWPLHLPADIQRLIAREVCGCLLRAPRELISYVFWRAL